MVIGETTKYVVTITAAGKPSASIACDDPLGAAWVGPWRPRRPRGTDRAQARLFAAEDGAAAAG